MPILPPFVGSGADSVSSVLTATRARVNDEIKTLYPTSGKLLQSNSYFTQQMFNNAWRRLQECLAAIGFTDLKRDIIISGIPIVTTTDPGVYCWIDQTGCFDGNNFFPQPALPTDMIIPLKVYERPSAQNALFGSPMEIFVDGLPSAIKQTYNGVWEWVAQQLRFPGSLQVMDFRLLYMRFLADFADVGGVQWFNQPVPILRCQTALSLFLCCEVANNRADMNAAVWCEKAEAAARMITNRDASMKQRGNFRRQSRSGRLEGACGWGGYGNC